MTSLSYYDIRRKGSYYYGALRDVAAAREAAFLALSSISGKKLAPIASHCWQTLWRFSGHPWIRCGSICSRYSNAVISLRVDLLPKPKFEFLSWWRTRDSTVLPMVENKFGSFCLVDISAAYGCIQNLDHESLARIDDTGCWEIEEVTLVEYAVALGAYECLGVLMRRFGLQPGPGTLFFLSNCRLGNVDAVARVLFSKENFPDLKEHLQPKGALTNPLTNAFLGLFLQLLGHVYDRDLCQCLLHAAGWGERLPEDIGYAIIKIAVESGCLLKEVLDRGQFKVGEYICSAAKRGDHEACSLLLKHGTGDMPGNAAMRNALEGDHLVVCQLLLRAGTAVGTPESAARWIEVAAAHHSMACLHFLLEAFAPELESALLNGVAHSDCVELLLNRGANPLCRTKRGSTAALLAACCGNIDSLRLLIAAGANVGIANRTGKTALLAAVEGRHLECFQALLAAGADPTCCNNRGCTPLMLAARSKQGEIVRELLRRGVDVNARDKCGRTALLCACRAGHWESFELLLQAGADVSARDTGGKTGLMLACTRQDTSMVAVLLDKGVDPNVVDATGETALSLTLCNPSKTRVALLLDYGAVPSVQEGGWTPLTKALSRKKFFRSYTSIPSWKLVLEAFPAFATIANDKGDSLLSLLSPRWNDEFKAVLRNAAERG